MSRYSFLTTWNINSDVDSVWDAIYRSESWPEWWKSVSEVTELKKGDDYGVGSIRRYRWKTPLGYSLIFNMETTKAQPPSLLEGIATGELEGTGLWQLYASDRVTTVIYKWEVSTTKAWMNLLAPLAEPLFRWNHNMVMDNGRLGLSKLLETSPGYADR